MRLHDLIAYNELNREGFRKALKKHDKVLARVAPKLLEEQRPRWESVLSDTSRQKQQVSFPSYSRLSLMQLSPGDERQGGVNVVKADLDLGPALEQHQLVVQSTVHVRYKVS